ncbi:MAG: NlpC/P60 family protein, partial [Lachnospiraceae bacterium]|nr:NlpC/P60 family protein [Lachnospiraceae bacterium]
YYASPEVAETVLYAYPGLDAETELDAVETEAAQAETEATQTEAVQAETEAAQTETEAAQTETAQAETEAAQTETEAEQTEAETTQTETEAAQTEAAQTETEAAQTETESGETEAAQTETESSQTEAETSSTASTGSSIASYALQFVGNPYVYGGTSLTNGADCSGFVQSVFAHFGIYLSRTAAGQAANGTVISTSELQAGDLLFYCTDGSTIDHVAIYIGSGMIVHAANSTRGICTDSAYYATPVCAVRCY